MSLITLQFHTEDHGVVNSMPGQANMFSQWSRLDRQDQNHGILTSGSASICKHCGTRYKLPCIVSLLPAKDICDELCGIFFTTVYPMIPVLHLPTFAADYRDFWTERSAQPQHLAIPSILRRKPGFVSLLSAIVFSSLVSGTERQLHAVRACRDTQVGDMYFATVMSATLTGFPRRPTLYSLAAYIYAQSQFVREEEFSDGPEFITTAFRVALGMGLHRNLVDVGFTAAESEMRRRLWWYILHLDVMSSCSSGLSPLFVDEKMGNSSRIATSDSLEEEYEVGDTGWFLASWSALWLTCQIFATS
jgi:hypothetical protein